MMRWTTNCDHCGRESKSDSDNAPTTCPVCGDTLKTAPTGEEIVAPAPAGDQIDTSGELEVEHVEDGEHGHEATGE